MDSVVAVKCLSFTFLSLIKNDYTRRRTMEFISDMGSTPI